MVVSNEVFRPGPDRRAVPGVQFRGETSSNSTRPVSIRHCWNVHRDGGTCDRAGRPLWCAHRPGCAPRRRRRTRRRTARSPVPAPLTCVSITRSVRITAWSSRRCSSERPPVGPSAPCWPAWRRSRFRRCREDRAHAALVARVEAIAGWAEMLRDTIAAAAGLEQAIAATAPLAPPPIRDEVVMLAARLERERLSTASASLRRRRRRSDLRPRRRCPGVGFRTSGPPPR